MMVINVHAAKTQFSRLLDAVAAGEEIIIAKAGKPVAKLVPVQADDEPRPLGLLEGQWKVPEDFDDPLPDAILELFYGPDAAAD